MIKTTWDGQRFTMALNADGRRVLVLGANDSMTSRGKQRTNRLSHFFNVEDLRAAMVALKAGDTGRWTVIAQPFPGCEVKLHLGRDAKGFCFIELVQEKTVRAFSNPRSGMCKPHERTITRSVVANATWNSLHNTLAVLLSEAKGEAR